jgi:hypothetical protein
MKEQDLVDLGFTKEFTELFYYYTYNLARGFLLITQASDEVVDNKWFVEFFDHPYQTTEIGFTDKKSVETLITTINKAKINE